MQERDFDQFDELMLGLAENYGQRLTPQGIALRFKMLEAYSIEQVREATYSILASRKYTTMPTVADFLEHLHGGSAEDRAQVEAGKVLQAIKDHGSWRSVVFDSPVTQAVIQQAYGGWIKLCEDCGAEESEKWFRKDFAATWAAYSRQSVQTFGALTGRTELQNEASGFKHTEPPRLVGIVEKALAVLEEGKNRIALASVDVRGLPFTLPSMSATADKPCKDTLQ